MHMIQAAPWSLLLSTIQIYANHRFIFYQLILIRAHDMSWKNTKEDTKINKQRGFTLIELLVVIAIIAILAAILFPVFAKARRAAHASTCQSNMKQIGNAIKMYLSDFDETYPTNSNLAGTAVQVDVQLTEPAVDPVTGKPLRFKYGIGWVEGLYNYVEAITDSNDAKSVWKCPAAGNATQPATGTVANTAAVTYAFNFNMAGQSEGAIRSASNLMLVRELDRRMNSVLRPTHATTSSFPAPRYPFLNNVEGFSATPALAPKQHGQGSHILFADNHVKLFDMQYFPSDANGRILAATGWDASESRWYNFYYANPATPSQRELNRSIAISP